MDSTEYTYAWAPGDSDGNPTDEYTPADSLERAGKALNEYPFGGFVQRTNSEGREEYSWGEGWFPSEREAVEAFDDHFGDDDYEN